MRPMPAQIEIYEQMCALSSRMVEAARASDWERLIDLERSVAGLRASLVKETDDATSRREAARRRELIQRILRNDAEVRRHTEPWMEQVRRFLNGTAHSIGPAHGTGH
jgi:flagellar protein FliT